MTHSDESVSLMRRLCEAAWKASAEAAVPDFGLNIIPGDFEEWWEERAAAGDLRDPSTVSKDELEDLLGWALPAAHGAGFSPPQIMAAVLKRQMPGS